MCKFEISVETKGPSEIAEAKKRLGRIPSVVRVKVSKNRRYVSAEAEIVGKGDNQMHLTGWAKDKFGMHHSLSPSVRILA